jgi:activating signal cointegrator 1
MKTLSLWQPHALAIGIGLKPWETRGWSTDYRGPIAIHAAKRSWTDVGPWHTEARQKLQEYVAKHGSVPWHFGAVVCTADLVSCVRTSTLRGGIPAEHEFWGDFTDGDCASSGRWAFKLENVKMLAQPVFVRGMQGWFEVDLGAEERVAAAGVLQLGLFDMFAPSPAPVAPAAPEIEQIATLFDDQEQISHPSDVDLSPGTPQACAEFIPASEPVRRAMRDQEKACELSRQFAEACDAAGFQYRGYEDQVGERVYAYSRPGVPELVYEMSISRWDRTAGALQQNAAAQGGM